MNQFLFSAKEVASVLNTAPCGAPLADSVSFRSVFTDTRATSPDSLFIALTGEVFDAHDYLAQAVAQGASALVIERAKLAKAPAGIPVFPVDSTVAAYQALARFHRMRFPDLKVIALTGSCGKTSTKETLRAIFEHAYGADRVLATLGNTNNQIGVPQNLFRLNEHHRIAILEMGTNHHGEIEPLSRAALPDAALVVSIGRCHLEFLGSLEGVAREKSQIFTHLASHGFAVIPHESAGHEILEKAAASFPHADFGFSPDAGYSVVYRGGSISGSSFDLSERKSGKTCTVRWALSGRHQAGNAAGAAAIAASFGIPLETIAEGIGKTTLPGMRMKVSEHHGATWINDAYNANPDSMKASLDWLSEFADPEHLLLVLGDMGEIGEKSAEAHRSVLRYARENFPAARLMAVGKKMSDAASILPPENLNCYADSASAASAVQSLIRPGDLIFLKASRSTKLELVEVKDETL